MPEELSGFVQGLTGAITRRADTYVEMLEESDSKKTLPADEEELLKKLEQYVADVLDRYVPPGLRHRDSLVFAHLYADASELAPADRGVSPDEQRYRLIIALLAAEVEARGPLRLTRAQNLRLAEIYRGLGRELRTYRLPLHAALAFEQAAGLYLEVEDHRTRDQCLLAQARARHQSPRPFGTRVLETVSEALCGYGYQPYRLLGWAVLQLVVFSLLLVLISPGSLADDIYLALTGFISPPGLDDSEAMSGLIRLLFVVEGYVGVMFVSVFFALLVRRWFRL
ncbi:MAG: hypothetical protein ACRDRV_21310 [Pseudonocardiaceae bacterium]